MSRVQVQAANHMVVIDGSDAAATAKPIILRFKYDGFANLSSEPGDVAYSREVTDRNGNTWRLHLYPGGDDDDDAGPEGAERDVALHVFLREGSTVNTRIAFIVRDASGSVHRYKISSARSLDLPHEEGRAKGMRVAIKRSEILDPSNNILVEGALMVDVELQMAEKQTVHEGVPRRRTRSWRSQAPSPNPVLEKLLSALESGDDADVTFKVEETLVPAHKLILKLNAPLLHSFCDEHEDDSPVPIEGTSPEVFRLVLRYVYGGDASEVREKLRGKSKPNKLGMEILDVANRYGIVKLKLVAETILVERRVVNLRNVVDWILFADSKTCPLLKEYAMNYASVMARDILADKSADKLKESPQLLSELMLAMSDDSDDRFRQTSRLTVGELRANLDEKGLDVDGSKEMLVSRLEESNKRQRTE